MSVNSKGKGLTNEVQEIVLHSGKYVMSVPSGTGEQINTMAHGLGIIPYVDYSWSLDGVTYKDRNDVTTSSQNFSLALYADDTNVYFDFYVFSTTATALRVYVAYKLYVVEGVK